MKQYQNKKLNFIAVIVIGLTISATMGVFADTPPSSIPPLTNYTKYSGSNGTGNGSSGMFTGYLQYTLYPWATNINTQVNINTNNIATNAGNIVTNAANISTNAVNISTNQGYFNILFGNGNAPTQTLTQYINSGISSNSTVTANTNAISTINNTTIPALTGTDGAVTNAIAALTGTNGAVTQAISTAVGALTGTNGSITALQTQQQKNTANISTNTANIATINTTTIPNLTSQITGLTGTKGAVTNAIAALTGTGGAVTNAISPLQSDINTINNATIPALTKAISTAVKPLQDNFATLFGTDKKGNVNTPTQTLGNYIRAGTTITIANALNTQNPKSNSPAQQLQSAVTSVVTPTITSAITQAFTTALALPSKSLPTGGPITQAISTAVTAVSSQLPKDINTSGTATNQAMNKFIQFYLSPSNSTFQSAIAPTITQAFTTALALPSKSLPTGGPITQAINTAIKPLQTQQTTNTNAISKINKTTIPQAISNAISSSNSTFQSAVNSLVSSNSTVTANTTAINTINNTTIPALTKAISTAVTPLQNSFAMLFGTDKKGNVNTPTQTLGNYIRAGTTITIANALNTQNPKSNSPAQQLQSAVTSVVAPTITQALTAPTQGSTSTAAQTALQGTITSAINTALTPTSQSTPGGPVTVAINTAISGLQSDINKSGSATNKAMNKFISSNSTVTALQTQQQKNTANISTNTANIATINTTTIPNLTSQITGLTGTKGAVTNAIAALTVTGGAVTNAISNAISPLQANFTTIFGSSTPSGNLQSYLNNGVAVALGNDSKGSPNSGNSQSAVQSVVVSALGGSGTDIKSAVSSSVASALEAGSTSITSAVHKYIKENFLTPPSSSSGATPSPSWTTFQSAVQSANQGANGFWYVNNLANLQSVLNSAGAVALSNNQQVVKLAGGDYDIGSQILTIPSYVTLEGVGKMATRITKDNTYHAVIMQPSSILSNLTVEQSSGYSPVVMILNSSNSAAQNSFTLSNVYLNPNTQGGAGPNGNASGAVKIVSASSSSSMRLVIESSIFNNVAGSTLALTISGQKITNSSIFMMNNSFRNPALDPKGGCNGIIADDGFFSTASFKSAGFSTITFGFNIGEGSSSSDLSIWTQC